MIIFAAQAKSYYLQQQTRLIAGGLSNDEDTIIEYVHNGTLSQLSLLTTNDNYSAQHNVARLHVVLFNRATRLWLAFSRGRG
ncbi:hypothetical protein IAD21_01234 [Abditibacteriota bacterium]|nr:hypothetical protein IAD21_01234 [Abditibacteriota bacterium]